MYYRRKSDEMDKARRAQPNHYVDDDLFYPGHGRYGGSMFGSRASSSIDGKNHTYDRVGGPA